MIWNSIGLMGAIDVVIVGVVGTALYFFIKYRKPLTDMGAAVGFLAVSTGLGVTGLFYSIDLFAMWVLPGLVPRGDAMRVMSELPLNYRWILTLGATGTISIGFLLIVRKMRDNADRLEQLVTALRESEERRRLFMDSATEHFVQYDANLTLIDVNRHALDTLGWRKEDVIGRNLVELFPEAESSGRLKKYLKVLETGEPLEMEAAAYLREGAQGNTVLRAFKVGDGIGMSSTDITERIKAEEALQKSEELRRLFMDSAGATFALFDAELNFLDLNAAGLDRFGLARKDVIGKNLAELSPETLSAGRFGRYLDVIRTGEPIRLEVVSTETRDGRHRVMDMRAFPVAGGLGVISEDITERKKAEADLRYSEERWRQFMEAAGESFVLLDADLNFVDVNRAGLEQANVTKEDVIGKNLADAWPASVSSGRYERYREVLKTGKPFRVELTDATRIGDPRTIDLCAFPVGDGLGVISEDISERKKAEAARLKSEETLHVFFESARDHFALLDRDMNLLHLNNSAVEALGYSLDTAVGKHLLEIAPQLAGTERYAGYLRVLETGEPYEAEAVLISRTGEERINAVTAFSAGDGVGIIIRDITEQKKSEAALRRSDEALRTVVDNAPILLWAVDLDRINTVLMGKGLQTLNIDPKKSLGQRQGKPRFYDPEIDEYLDAALNGEDQTYSVTIEGIDFETRLVPLRDSRGAIEGAIGVSVDVTDRKHAERELAKLNQDLEELVAERTQELRTAQDDLINAERLAAVGHVTATVAHELRNPLGTIRTSLFSLRTKDPGMSEGSVKIFERIERNIMRCDQIISELLDYSGSRALQLQTTNLSRSIAAWVEDYQLSEGVKISLSIPDAKATAHCDPGRLHQVVVNLLDNARQAVEEGPESGRGIAEIALRAAIEDGRFILEVADDGPGIPEDVLPRIFEPLFSTKGFGVGLGLPLVKKIVDQHGGDIEVVTVAGEGTTFRITLPLPDSKEAAA